MRPIINIVLMVAPAAVVMGVILAAPNIGLGSNEGFILYRWFGISRSESLFCAAAAAWLALLYPISAIAAGAFSKIAAPEKHLSGSNKANYRPEIDGLRALAVSAVIVNHLNADWLPSGFLGVDVFFVISGYVILASMMASKTSSMTDFLVTFYVKRVKRLLPALLLFTIVCGIAICLVSPAPAASLYTGISSLFGVSNIYLFWQSADYFAPSTQYNAFAHTWSLGVEEQFYLVFPLLVYACVFWQARASSLTGALIVLTAASYLYWHSQLTSDSAEAFFLMPARFWELGIGAITYLITPKVRRARSGLLAILACLLIASFFAPAQYSPAATTTVVASTALLIGLMGLASSGVHGALTLAPVLFVGRISYSLYLWHWGVIAVARWVGAAAWWIPLLVALMLALAALELLPVSRTPG